MPASPRPRGERPADALRRRVRWTGTLAVALALAACGALPPIGLKPPKVAFAELQLTSVSAQELRFLVHVEAHNPNDVDLPLSNVRFDVLVVGQPIATAAARETTFTLPANAARRIPFDMRVPTQRFAAVLAQARAAGAERIDYRITGYATWGTSGLAIPIERAGTLQLPRRLFEQRPAAPQT